MLEVIAALAHRSSELAGKRWKNQDLMSLEEHIPPQIFIHYVRVFTEFAISEVILEFENSDPKVPTSPSDSFDDPENESAHACFGRGQRALYLKSQKPLPARRC